METTVPKLLRVQEVAEQTGLQTWRLYKLLQAGEGPPHMWIGKTIRISEHALTKWIDERHAATANGKIDGT